MEDYFGDDYGGYGGQRQFSCPPWMMGNIQVPCQQSQQKQQKKVVAPVQKNTVNSSPTNLAKPVSKNPIDKLPNQQKIYIQLKKVLNPGLFNSIYAFSIKVHVVSGFQWVVNFKTFHHIEQDIKETHSIMYNPSTTKFIGDVQTLSEQ